MAVGQDQRGAQWAARPQVGRFYGDFLCMGRIRENTIFPARPACRPESPFNSRIWSWFGDRRMAYKQLESLANSGGK